MIAHLAAALTARRMIALAIVSTLATTAVVVAATRRHENTADLAAFAALRRAPAIVAAAPIPSSRESASAPATGVATPTPAPSAASAKASLSATAPATTTSTTPSSAGSITTTKGTSGPPRAQPAKIKHVFVIVLAGQGDQAFAPTSPARYLSTQLRPQGALLSGYAGLGSGELPDYIALVSGEAPNPDTGAGCPTYADFPSGLKPDPSGQVPGAGCVYPISTLTLPDQLTSAGLTWRAYVEDMGPASGAPTTCRHPGPGGPDPTAAPGHGDEYATRHNPFVYFHSLLDLGDCATNDVTLDRLGNDLSAIKTTPNLAFITPNLCHGGGEQPCLDGTPGGLPAADAFLSQWVRRITQSPAYRANGLLVIAFAGGSATQTRTGALLLSRYARPGSTSNVPYDAYSLLRSIEDIFALKHLAGAAAPGIKTLLSDAIKDAR